MRLGPTPGHDGAVVGAAIIVVVILFVLPPVFLMIGAAISALLGRTLRVRAEEDHAGSELIDLNH